MDELLRRLCDHGGARSVVVLVHQGHHDIIPQLNPLHCFNMSKEPQSNGDGEGQEQEDTTMESAFKSESKRVNLLSLAQREAVDRSFESLFGYKFGQPRSILTEQQEKLLVHAVGPETASLILNKAIKLSTTEDLARKIQIPSRKIHTSFPRPTKSSSSDRIPQKAGKSFAKVQVGASKTAASKTKTSAPPPSAKTKASSTPSATEAPHVGIDQLLSDLNASNKVSTLSKTSTDWDSFKSKNAQLGTKIEEKAESKDAFLNRQDFLSRVDQRRFEAERQQRDRERAKRGK